LVGALEKPPVNDSFPQVSASHSGNDTGNDTGTQLVFYLLLEKPEETGATSVFLPCRLETAGHRGLYPACGHHSLRNAEGITEKCPFDEIRRLTPYVFTTLAEVMAEGSLMP